MGPRETESSRAAEETVNQMVEKITSYKSGKGLKSRPHKEIKSQEHQDSK